MAAILSLVRREDMVVDVDSLSLLAYTDGIEVAHNGWIPAVARMGDKSVWETLSLRVRGTSHDNLASRLQALDEKIKQIEDYRLDSMEQYGVWLRAKLANETYQRQALVLEANPAPKSSVFNQGLIAKNQLNHYDLALKRVAWWEDISTRGYNIDDINCLGGTFDYTTYGGGPGSVLGDVPARLARVRVAGVSGGGGPIAKFWLGFRTDRFGNRTLFQSYWDCKNGSLSNSAATTPDATARSGTRVNVPFTSEGTPSSFLTRVTVSASQAVPSNYGSQVGNYVILLRAKCSDGSTTCRIRLGEGLVNSSAFATKRREVVSGTDWKLYELGTAQIPTPTRLFAGTSLIQHYALRIEAERIAGSGSLDLDCFILIPQSEGFVYAEGGSVQWSGSDTNPLDVQVQPDGQANSAAYTLGSARSVGVPIVRGGLPPGAGIAVFAAQRSASSVLTDFVDVNLTVYQRWRTLRGSEVT